MKLNHLLRFVPIAIELSEAPEGQSAPQRIQLLKTGTFNHPEYGNFTITAADLVKMKENFDAGVRGIDIALDYAHDSDREAAGWFRTVELSDDGQSLWATIDWTMRGKEKVISKEYRYISSDFSQNYTDNENKRQFGPTLNGAALTNRPFIKGMDAVIELSEGKAGPTMDPKDQEIASLKAQIEELKKAASGKDAEFGEMKKKLEEYDAKQKEQAAAAQLAEKKGAFDKMLSEKKVVEAQREPWMKDDMSAFAAAAKPLKLSEIGSENEGSAVENTGSKDAEDQIIDKANVLLAEGKVASFDAAVSKVLTENPDLNKSYLAAQAAARK